MKTNLSLMFAMILASAISSNGEVRNACELPFNIEKVRIGGVNHLGYSELPPPNFLTKF